MNGPPEIPQQNGTYLHTGSLTTPRTPLDESENKGCGWLYFRPKCLQSKQTAKWVLFWLCWAGAIQGMVVNGFVNVCITTIEKRYHLKSADTGLIAGAYDIASVLCSIPVSYFGSIKGASKPRWLGWGLLLMALGSFTFALPHFISPMYKTASSSLDGTSDLLLCLSQVNVTPHCADNAENWLSSFRHIFGVGQFLHGVGASPLYTLGITYLDESVPVRASSIYLGIFYAMAIIGPAMGFVIGGQLLKVYIDTPLMTDSLLGISPLSEQWLGAWWIGFLLSGVLAIIIAWIIMAFPPEIPGSKTRESQRTSANLDENNMTVQTIDNIRDLPKAAKALASNATFVCLSLAGATEGILLTGFATFMPKFIESQFGVAASNAALLVGFIAVPAGGGGTLIGGWLIKHYNWKCKGVLKVCTFLSALGFLCSLSFVFSCPDNNFAGVTVPYLNGSVPYSPKLQSSCNGNCGCADVPYDPVCGANVLYYSPCHAGCKAVKIENGRKVFTDCKCISERLQFRNNDFNSSALLMKCPSSCSIMPLFLLIFFFIMLVTFMMSMPAVSGTLRCVPDNFRSLALGLQWIVIRVLGTIPGPILFGTVIDSSCRLWQTSCNIIGSCASYNNLRMSRSLMTLSLVFKALSTLFFFLAWRFYISPKRRIIVDKPMEDRNSDDGLSISTITTAATTPL